MEQPLITVIVPVYKAEHYLEKCIQGLLRQTHQNLEIILVNDGSPDNSGAMCDSFAKRDARIRVIHKENGGASSARNAGLNAMRGDYVGFIDSDDWIEPNMFEHMLSLLTAHHAQIAACGLQCDYGNGTTVYFNGNYPHCKDVEVYSRLDALREAIIGRKITPSMCDKMLKASIFQNLRFREGTVNEDFELVPQCIELADTVVYDPLPLYHYVIDGESVTHGTFKKSRFTEAQVSRNLMAHYQEHYPSLYPYALAKHAEICMNLVQASAADNAFAEERKDLIAEVRAMKKRRFFRFLDRKNQFKLILFSLSVPLFVRAMTRYYNR